EHLVEGSGLLGELIERAPHVELLTTSRERLNVQSEWVFDVEGLGLAENGNGSASAVRLFVERAKQVAPGFALDDAAEVLRICRLVDGMPLGIELAASWVSVLSCAEIADEIEGNIDFLATSTRDVPERHRSLRAAIDQSWRLLTDEQRSAFSRLSVFRGSFDRSAAVAVTGADLSLFSQLVAKSLLRRPDFGRFERAGTLERLARTAGFDSDDPGSASAVALAAAACRIAIGARLGHDPAAEELARRCVPVLRARNLERDVARCLCALGIGAVYRDVFPDAVAFLEEGIEITRTTSDTLTEPGALMDLGFARLLMDDLDAARDAFEAANVLCDKLGNPLLRAYGTSKLGLLADAEERYGDALRLHLAANELFASVGEVGGAGYALSRASSSAFGLGDYSEALRLGRAGYDAFSE